ncbi:MAG: hypothetical protein ACYC27_03160 [Armatimonadota bacterium]
MIPLTQTITGERGNCLMTSLASILEIPLESCPDIWDAKDNGISWYETLWNFADQQGYRISLKYPHMIKEPIQGYSLVVGASPRGFKGGHCCVAFNGEIVHDPYPDRTGLLSIDYFIKLVPIEGCTDA